MLLMIDNYDSFTFNLVQYFQQLGQQPVIKRNDEIGLDEIRELAPDYLVISPGPVARIRRGSRWPPSNILPVSCLFWVSVLGTSRWLRYSVPRWFGPSG